MNYWTQSSRNIYVAGHMGWCAKYPDNTMESFRGALEIGVDQIETDVRMSKDGELVLIHDATVDRTTNGTGNVCDMTLAELQALDAGIKRGPQFQGCRIPALRELMELVKDHPTITLDIELKVYPEPGNEAYAYHVCDKAMEMIDEYGFTDRIVVNSASYPLNTYIHNKYGSKYRQHLYYPVECFRGERTEDPYAYGYCACIFGLDNGLATVDTVHQFHKDTGVRVWAGSYAKDEAGVDLAVELGAELITCDNPDEILAILRKKGLHT